MYSTWVPLGAPEGLGQRQRACTSSTLGTILTQRKEGGGRFALERRSGQPVPRVTIDDACARGAVNRRSKVFLSHSSKWGEKYADPPESERSSRNSRGSSKNLATSTTADDDLLRIDDEDVFFDFDRKAKYGRPRRVMLPFQKRRRWMQRHRRERFRFLGCEARWFAQLGVRLP